MAEWSRRRRHSPGQGNHRTRHRAHDPGPQRGDRSLLWRRLSFGAGIGGATEDGLSKCDLDGRRLEALGRAWVSAKSRSAVAYSRPQRGGAPLWGAPCLWQPDVTTARYLVNWGQPQSTA